MNRATNFAADQRGIAPLLIVLLIGAAALISLGVAFLGESNTGLRQQSVSSERLGKIEQQLRVYSYENSRLPCPANPDADGGARPDCTGANNAGIVPWKTLGLTREAAQDDFGRMISYVIDPALVSGDFCAGLPTALAGGLGVLPSGGPRLFALISHGPNGFGAWLPAGRQMPNPASTLERNNCSSVAANPALVLCNDPLSGTVAAGPFNTDITSPNYFDDTVLLANSADYDPVCAATAASGVTGAQISFSDIHGTAPAGTEGRLSGSDPFRGTTDSTSSSAPRVTVGAAGAPTLLRFGVASGAPGRSCIFTADELNLRIGITDKVLRNYVEFAFRADDTGAGARGEGIVLAFVPNGRSVDDEAQFCGGVGARLGFQQDGGGDYPVNHKFGVEIDTHFNASAAGLMIADPPNNHIAIDRNEVLHRGASGPKCIAGAPGSLDAPPKGCTERSMAPADRDWLEQGQTNFHQLRVDVYANGHAVLPDDCGMRDIAVMAWLFENGSQCTDGCNDLSRNYANTGMPAKAMVRHCLAVPHDKVLVGITTGYISQSSEPVLRNFGVTEAAP